MSQTLTLTLTLILRNLSKRKEKEINRELNIYLFDEILYSFEISTSVSKKSFYKIGALYTELSFRIKHVNFSIKKNSFFVRWST